MNVLLELLAPVGSREALVAAVESGADAVYLGGKMFGARQYAVNFDDDEMAEAVRFCHLRGVKVLITVNTLVDNSELPELTRYLRFLYRIGVDAVIVQDWGVARIARQVVPELPLHASTQMTIHNLAGVLFAARHGLRRVVLARELSLPEIEYICQNSPIEIEVFIHGALCICYSGQCLMSGMIGGRSGNRGRCAQPCRMNYQLLTEAGDPAPLPEDVGEYLLSPRDLNTIEWLPQLVKAGVASFKIEGRMKRPEYVAVVVDTYRQALNQIGEGADNKAYQIAAEDRRDLAQIFNRDFTTAYLEGRPGREMMSDRRPNNRGTCIGRVSRYQHDVRTAVLRLEEPLMVGDVIDFWVKVGGRVNVTVHRILVNGQEVEQAQPGEQAVIALPSPVRDNDRVFKVFDVRLMNRARAFFNRSEAVRRLAVDVTVTVGVGAPLTISLKDQDGFTASANTAFIGEAALKRPLTDETVTKQVSRIGNTVFEIRCLDIAIDGQVMVPVSEINEARRQAIEALEAARLAVYDRPALAERSGPEITGIPAKPVAANKIKTLLAVNVDTGEKVQAALNAGADIIQFGGENFTALPYTREDYEQAVGMVRRAGKKMVLTIPRLLKEAQLTEMVAAWEWIGELQPDALSIGNVGALEWLRQRTDIPLQGDYPLNVYNKASAKFFQEQGLGALTLSPELNLSQIDVLTASLAGEWECLVHGRLELMISEYCLLGGYLGGRIPGPCRRPCRQGRFMLKDRLGESFPVVTDQYCRMHILNAKELSMLPHVGKLSALGIRRLRVEGKFAPAAEVGVITGRYRELLDQGEQHPRVQSNQWQDWEHHDITRGHYFRGVL
ncbi:MAG TPA: DUF3656 domain-containing protein, partial [Patescibacteria group bacterium]|nr:DUF3656 domain-containing protein [Patescibacteria group bacterium]